jgi:aminoglycoside phosphotransferase (APT) family kinase protein
MTAPPAESLAWVASVLGPRRRIIRWERLTGGITSIVHALTVEHNGQSREVVLRRITPPSDWGDWALGAVRKETAVLTSLEHHGIPVPRVLGATNDAQHGGPAILMTRVPGRMVLLPDDREQWLREMARTLHRIHQLSIEAPPYESWLRRDSLVPPPDAARPDLWREAFAFVAGDEPPARTCFIHRDYQHFNLLWSGERLSGVVDWVEACIGPPEADVGHCRLNLTVLFSADVADRFRDLYEAEAGVRIDPRWDVRALLSYGAGWKEFIPLQVDGRAPVDCPGMTARMEAVLERALHR